MRVLTMVLVFMLVGCGSTPTELPILSYKMDASGNTIYYTIDYEGFSNQLGQSLTTKTIADKVFIANFFFTSCPSICPPMRTELIKIAENFKDNEDFLIISHTIDPENDSEAVLHDYAELTGITSSSWQFLRSSPEKTREQANAYMTNFRPTEDGTDFYHSSYVALVDQQQYIRGFYNLLVKEEVKRLNQDVARLLH